MKIHSSEMEFDEVHTAWYINGIVDKPKQYKIKRVNLKGLYGPSFEVRNMNDKLLKKKLRNGFNIFTKRQEAYDERERILRAEAVEKLKEAEMLISEAAYFLKYLDEEHTKVCDSMRADLDKFEKEIKNGK